MGHFGAKSKVVTLPSGSFWRALTAGSPSLLLELCLSGLEHIGGQEQFGELCLTLYSLDCGPFWWQMKALKVQLLFSGPVQEVKTTTSRTQAQRPEGRRHSAEEPGGLGHGGAEERLPGAEEAERSSATTQFFKANRPDLTFFSPFLVYFQ